jgi:hypothetical protein
MLDAKKGRVFMDKKDQSTQSQQPAKPGSDPEAARRVGGKGDFGVSADEEPERSYVSQNTKASDRGAAQPHAGSAGGRVAGVGGHDSGPGSSSGGDIDTDVVGVGTGRGLSASGPSQRPPGPDDSHGTSEDFASGKPGEGKNQTNVHKIGGSKTGKGSTVQGATETDSGATGADAANNPGARGDDAFTGEVSSGEATGQDSR